MGNFRHCPSALGLALPALLLPMLPSVGSAISDIALTAGLVASLAACVIACVIAAFLSFDFLFVSYLSYCGLVFTSDIM